MNILVFDMDGVLLMPQGYHRALRETVRMAGLSTGFGEVVLSDEQIARFEALGISSEWHSSAMCMALMELQKQDGKFGANESLKYLNKKLEELFEAIEAQPLQEPAIERGLIAIEHLAEKDALSSAGAKEIIAKSDSIADSPTMNWFQEFILGSKSFAEHYQKQPQFEQESYLSLFDQPLIGSDMTEKLLAWAAAPGNGASIMTNRPSRGPGGYLGDPDAELGTSLVGLQDLPLIGYGEMIWLAETTGRDVGKLSKPGLAHSLSAVLAASGWSMEKSLGYLQQGLDDLPHAGLDQLRGSTITVFEDTPGGVVAVQKAGEFLNDHGLQVDVKAKGIAGDKSKQAALIARGAEIYRDINQALASLEYF